MQPLSKKCILCGKPFRTNMRRRVACTAACHTRYKNLARANALDRFDPATGTLRPLAIVRTCPSCGKSFVTGHGNKRYCKISCSQKARYGEVKNRWFDKCDRDYKTYLARLFTSIKTDVKCAKRKRAAVGPVTVTKADLARCWESQGGRCALTGFAMTHVGRHGFQDHNASVDRIDNNGPYSKENVRLVCATANLMRRRLSDAHLLLWASAIVATLGKAPPRKRGQHTSDNTPYIL